jgi:hypothetical protein
MGDQDTSAEVKAVSDAEDAVLTARPKKYFLFGNYEVL